MDIGSLTGRIELEDKLTEGLSLAMGQVKKFAEEFTSAMGVTSLVAGAATAAIGLISGAIVGLGEKGSTLIGIQEAFDRLAQSAGTTGDVLRGALTEGVKGTVSEMDLMQSTTRLLSTGMKLSAEQATLMGEAARALGKATGTDAASGLETLSGALTTGRVRGLQQQIGLIDLKKGEEEFAKSIHTTASELNEAGKLEGKRIAILDATRAYVERLGVSEVSFKERILQGRVAVEEWMKSMAMSVASSADVNQALKDVSDALSTAFGTASKTFGELILSGINAFARGVSEIVPYVVKLADGIKDLVKFFWSWRDAIEVVVAGFIAYKAELIAIELATWAANVATVAYEGVMTLLAGEAEGLGIAMTGALGPINLIAIAIAGIFAAYKIGQLQMVSDYFENLGLVLQGWSQKEIDAQIAGEHAAAAERERTKGLTALQLAQERVGKVVGAVAGGEVDLTEEVKRGTKGFIDNGKAIEEHEKKVKELLKTLSGSGEATSVIIDAFNRLTTQQKGNYDVQELVIKQLDILIEHHKRLTSEQLRVYTAGVQMRAQLADQDASILGLKGVSLEYIEVLKSRGYTEQNVAAILGVSVAGLKLYQDKLKETSTRVDDFRQTGQEGAAAVAKSLAGMPLVLVGLAQSMGPPLGEVFATVRLGARDIATTGALIGTSFTEAERVIADATTQSAKDFIPLSTEQLALVERMDKIGISSEEMARVLGVSLTQVEGHTFGYLKAITDNSNATLQRMADESKKIYEYMAAHPKEFYATTREQFRKIAQAAQDAATGNTHAWTTSFTAISAAIPGLIQQAFTGGGGVQGAMKAAGSLVGNELSKGLVKHLTEVAPKLMGSALGQMIASAIPIVGAIAGPLMEKLADIIMGKPAWAKAIDEVSRDFGTKISENLGKEIASAATDFGKSFKFGGFSVGGSRQAAEISLLDKVISEAKGLNPENIKQMADRFHDVFSMIQTGAMTASQGMAVLDKNFLTFTAAATSQMGVLSQKIVDIIKLDQQFGTHSVEIAKYVSGQVTANVFGGLTRGLTVGTDALKSYDELKQKEIDLRAQMEKTKDVQQLEGLRKDLDETTGKLSKAGLLIDAVKISSQETASAMAGSIIAGIGELQRGGLDFVSALQAATPAIQALQTQLDQTGLDGGEAFSQLKGYVDIASDAIAGPALKSVASYGQALTGLQNSGLLTQSMFEGLASQIAHTHDELIAQGKDSNAINRLMAPQLQQIWEIQQQTGEVLDDNTQKLVDEAIAQGIVGEKFKGPQQQMIDALSTTNDILTAIAKSLGATLPEAAQHGAKGVKDALDGIPDTHDVHVRYTSDEVPAPPHARTEEPISEAVGGIVPVYAQRGRVIPFVPHGTDTVPAMLTPGERVLSLAQTRQYDTQQQSARLVPSPGKAFVVSTPELDTSKIAVQVKGLETVLHNAVNQIHLPTIDLSHAVTGTTTFEKLFVTASKTATDSLVTMHNTAVGAATAMQNTSAHSVSAIQEMARAAVTTPTGVTDAFHAVDTASLIKTVKAVKGELGSIPDAFDVETLQRKIAQADSVIARTGEYINDGSDEWRTWVLEAEKAASKAQKAVVGTNEYVNDGSDEWRTWTQEAEKAASKAQKALIGTNEYVNDGAKEWQIWRHEADNAALAVGRVTKQVEPISVAAGRATRLIEPTSSEEPTSFAVGGIVPAYAAQGRVINFVPRGTDTAPAMLTPGERVLSVPQNRQFEQQQEELSQPQKQTVFYITNNIAALDAKSFKEMLDREGIPYILEEVADNRRGYQTRLNALLKRPA